MSVEKIDEPKWYGERSSSSDELRDLALARCFLRSSGVQQLAFRLRSSQLISLELCSLLLNVRRSRFSPAVAVTFAVELEREVSLT